MYPRNMQKEYINLSQIDHNFLMTIVSRGQTSARVFRRATALSAVAKTLGVSRQTVSQRSTGTLPANPRMDALNEMEPWTGDECSQALHEFQR